MSVEKEVIKGQVKIIQKDKQNRILQEWIVGTTTTPTRYGWETAYDTPIYCDENTTIQTYDPNSKVETFESELEELLNRYCFINETILPNRDLAKYIFQYILTFLKMFK